MSHFSIYFICRYSITHFPLSSGQSLFLSFHVWSVYVVVLVCLCSRGPCTVLQDLNLVKRMINDLWDGETSLKFFNIHLTFFSHNVTAGLFPSQYNSICYTPSPMVVTKKSQHSKFIVLLIVWILFLGIGYRLHFRESLIWCCKLLCRRILERCSTRVHRSLPKID